jgi:RNA polymerase sigma factor (sigma-70 family)
MPDHGTASDEELVLGARSDPDGFAVFYRRHAPGLLGYLVRRLGDAELAADVCAETFAVALDGAARFRPERGPAVAWLYGIARHKLVDAQRTGVAEQTARRRLGIPHLELSDEGIERVHATGDAGALRAAWDELPVAHRRALTARVVEERTYEDVACELGTSPVTARQRVSRALAALRTRLGDLQ